MENSDLSNQDNNLFELKKCILEFCIRNNVNDLEVGLIKDIDDDVIDCNIIISFN